MDYRERAQAELARIAAQTEEAARIRREQEALVAPALEAARMQREAEARLAAETFKKRVEATKTALDSIGLEAMLEEANRTVWDARGTVKSISGVPFDPKDPLFWRSVHLDAHIPKIALLTEPINRLRFGTHTVSSSTNPEGHSSHEDGYGFYTKWVGNRVTGYTDIGVGTRLSVSIKIPISVDADLRGTLEILDSSCDWERGLKYEQDPEGRFRIAHPSPLRGLLRKTPDSPEPYMIDGDVLEFPANDFNPETLKSFTDTGILLSSFYRLHYPLTEQLQRAEEDRAAVIAAIGKKIPWPNVENFPFPNRGI